MVEPSIADPLDLAAWSGAAIKAECGRAWSRYNSELAEHYTCYFADHPDLRSEKQRFSAKDLGSALPDGWEHLGKLIPKSELHPRCLSGKSSQVLAMALLGAATQRDPELRWLWRTLRPGLPSPRAGTIPRARLERRLDPAVLQEQPFQTAIDLLVETDDSIVCIECKWAEESIGSCSCPPGAPAVAACSTKVRGRPAYWSAANEILGLPERRDGSPCPISWAYQAVRNVAAAEALAGDRHPVFALVYDESNPYFGGCGRWPGWAPVLEKTINDYSETRVRFVSTSWQQLCPLICSLPGMEEVAEWAAQKHRLPV